MKRKLVITVVLGLLLITSIIAGDPIPEFTTTDKNVSVIHLTNKTFKQMVFNYENSKEWKYEGTKPAIVDFYANWCSPCRQLSPIIEELAKEYSGKIIVYKVDTDKEQELSQNLGISSLPTLLFIPLKGQPQAALGALPKETLIQVINEVLLVN